MNAAQIIGYVLGQSSGVTAAQVAVALGLATLDADDAEMGIADDPVVDEVEDVLCAAVEACQLRASRVFGLTKLGTTASLGLAARVGWP